MVQQISLSKGADGRWLGVFQDVPLFADGAVVPYTVTEEPLENYTMTAVQLPSPGTVSASEWSSKITPASESVYPIGDAEVVVAKKGGTYDVWSLHTLNAVQQQALVEQINRANLQGIGATLKLGNGGNTEMRFGLPAEFQDKKGNTVEIRAGQNGTEIAFADSSVWSLFYYGSMTVEEACGAIIKNVYQAPATPTPATPTPATPTPATPTPGTPTPATPTATPKPTPEPEIPKTGDSRNAMVWLGLALAAGAALLVPKIRRFKRAK